MKYCWKHTDLSMKNFYNQILQSTSMAPSLIPRAANYHKVSFETL